jgi:hypothetical protein
MRNRIRVIAAAAVTAALAAASAPAAMASTTGTKPGAFEKTASVSVRCAPASDLAAQLGVSQARLDRALREVKTSLSTAGTTPTENQFVSALARALGVPRSQVRQAFAAEKPCPGKPAGSKPGRYQPASQSGSDVLASAVAKELHVSTAQVDAALGPIFAAGHADPSSPTFAAAARALGVSTQQLSAALTEAKQSLAAGS